jgi:hypothetical protein
MRSWQMACVAILSLLVINLSVPAIAAQPPTLPSNWQSLGPADFVNVMAPFYDPIQDKLVGNFDQNQVQTYAATLISQINVGNSTLGFQVLDALHWIASPALSAAQQQQVKQGLLSRNDNWQGQPYAELRGKIRMMRRVMVPTLSRVQEGARWAQAGGQLSAVLPQDIPEAYLYFVSTPLQPVFGSFAVHWQGQITAPQTGNYTLSISPINVNSQDARYPVQLTVTLNVGGNVVLTAKPRNEVNIRLIDRRWGVAWSGSQVDLDMDFGYSVSLAFTGPGLGYIDAMQTHYRGCDGLVFLRDGELYLRDDKVEGVHQMNGLQDEKKRQIGQPVGLRPVE